MISTCVYYSNLTKFGMLMIGVEQYMFTLSMYVNMLPYVKFYIGLLNDENYRKFVRNVSDPCCSPTILRLANAYITIKLQIEMYKPKLQIELSMI